MQCNIFLGISFNHHVSIQSPGYNIHACNALMNNYIHTLSLLPQHTLQAKHRYNKFLCLQKPCYNIVMQSYRNRDKRTLDLICSYPKVIPMSVVVATQLC